MHAREREAIYKAIKRYIDGENFPHSQLRTLVSKLFESEQETRREITELEQEYDEMFNQKSEIPWIKYDPENPPETGRDYLVSDGRNFDTAYYQKFFDDDPPRWYPPDLSSIEELDITHYAPINLPGEETT